MDVAGCGRGWLAAESVIRAFNTKVQSETEAMPFLGWQLIEIKMAAGVWQCVDVNDAVGQVKWLKK